MSVIDLTFDDDDREASATLQQLSQATPRHVRDEIYELSDSTPTAPDRFNVASQPPGRKRKRVGTQELALGDTAVESADDTQVIALQHAAHVIEVGDSPIAEGEVPVDVEAYQDTQAQMNVGNQQYTPTQSAARYNGNRGVAPHQYTNPSSYQAHGRQFANAGAYGGQMPFSGAGQQGAPYSDSRIVLPRPPAYTGPDPAMDTSASQRTGAAASMRMIGQLRAVAVVSTGSIHYREGTATQVPTTLRNRRGAAQEVELYDQAGGLIGMLEQSVTRTIFSLQASGHIKVAGMTAGPLRGKFISPIQLSFYADQQLALGIMRVLEESGLFLDQSTAETQRTMDALGASSNALTQGMNYRTRHPTRDGDGLMSLHSNSDSVLPSVFADMEFTSTAYGDGGGELGGEWTVRTKERFRAMPLPATMRVVGRAPEPEDAKTRLASIKSTFVTLLDLPETDAPALITTALRRHQKQALYFMMHRETDGVDVEGASDIEAAFPKLWVLSGERCRDTARQEYSHALVNVHCVGPPAPLRGGILADDMGLGKTLSTIALIARLPPSRRPGERVKFGGAASSTSSPKRFSDVSLRKRTTASRGKNTAASRRKHKAPNRKTASGSSSTRSQGTSQKPRIARNSRPSRSRRRVVESKSDSDSFTELPPAKRTRQSRAASQAPVNSVLSDSEDLTDDPLSFVAAPSGSRPQLVRPDLSSDYSSSSSSSDVDGSYNGGSARIKSHSESVSDNDDGSSSDESDPGYESDGRPMTPPPEFDNLPTKNKVACERRFSDNYHGRYAGNTLIVCPLSTMSNWEEQIATHVRARGMSVYAYHGNTRTRSVRRLCHYDVVLTTFNVLQSEYTRETRQLLAEETAVPVTGPRAFDSSSEEESSTKTFQVPDYPYVSPLQSVHWHRTVLDEAHNIKERRTISSLAAYALHADRRWCLTGTPIQNRLDDLYSQLRFLHATPLDNWKIWLTYIAAPFHANTREMGIDGQVEEANIGANRVQRLMQSICLRRMKQQIDTRTNRTIIELPPKFERVRWLELAAGERRLYQMAEDIARSKFANMARSGTVLKNYMNILKIILRLRQLCTHPRLWSADKWNEARTLAADKNIAEANAAGDLPANPEDADAKPEVAIKGESAVTVKGESEVAVKGESTMAKAELNEAKTELNVAKDEPELVSDEPVILEPGALQCDMLYSKWDDAVRTQGPLAKCEFCGGNAIPTALLQYGDMFGATDYPGPAITKCKHLVCQQCQVVLCGAAPANPREEAMLINEAAPLTECMLCGELLGPTDALRLSAQRILQSLGAAPPPSEGSEAPPAEEDPYLELDRMCSEQATSTKITTLLSDIDKVRRRKWFADPGFDVDQTHPAVAARKAELLASPDAREKCVVFSQWTSMLNLIEPLLEEQDIRFTRLDGGMPRPQRESNLRRFKQDPDVEVLLLSLRAGGVGLNLAHASHVFLMDAFWNPSVENQAIDRIHRLGQVNPITVTRYFVKDSIEEKIMKLQLRKAKIVDISLMDSTRTSHVGSSRTPGETADADDMLAITTGTHSRQQRLDDLNLLLG
ncbi:hypothetical protein GGH12_003050 [Coemansia sp. RSA 1822]|nr:hypothetical protein LPJ76_002752 [Coemansia sp. RSA 638]KAJ2562663.1 hypothetical protein GGH12_003050 [Coemansia sp. RSA 1822]